MLKIIRLSLEVVVITAAIILPHVVRSGELRSLDLRSNDIACVSCALTIKKTVSRIEGVKKVEVSARTKKIHAEYDESRVTEDQIIQKISGLGYRVEKVKPK